MTLFRPFEITGSRSIRKTAVKRGFRRFRGVVIYGLGGNFG
jgi:hypothetical protein